MRYDIQKRLFLTKKMVELKIVRLFQRAYRSKFKNKPCPTVQLVHEQKVRLEKKRVMFCRPGHSFLLKKKLLKR